MKTSRPKESLILVVDGEHYLLTANEMSGTVECFKIIQKDAKTLIQ